MIACPAATSAISQRALIPVAAELTERFADLDGCSTSADRPQHQRLHRNSRGHHHSGHIGILGVDKDGRWYQVTLADRDGSAHAPVPGKVIGPSFAASGSGRRGRIFRDHRELRRPTRSSSTRCTASAWTRSGRRQRLCTATACAPEPRPTDIRNTTHHEVHRHRPTTRGTPSAARTVVAPGPRTICCGAAAWRGGADLPTGTAVGVIAQQRRRRDAVRHSTAPVARRCSSRIMGRRPLPRAAPCCGCATSSRADPRHRRGAGRHAAADAARRRVFDAVALRRDQSREAAERALADFAGHYWGAVGEARRSSPVRFRDRRRRLHQRRSGEERDRPVRPQEGRLRGPSGGRPSGPEGRLRRLAAPSSRATSLGAEDMVVTDLIARHHCGDHAGDAGTGALHGGDGRADPAHRGARYGLKVEVYRPVRGRDRVRAEARRRRCASIALRTGLLRRAQDGAALAHAGRSAPPGSPACAASSPRTRRGPRTVAEADDQGRAKSILWWTGPGTTCGTTSPPTGALQPAARPVHAEHRLRSLHRADRGGSGIRQSLVVGRRRSAGNAAARLPEVRRLARESRRSPPRMTTTTVPRP